MTGIAVVCSNLHKSQERWLQLHRMENAWRPENGWQPHDPVLCQIRAGLMTQEREQRRCAHLLSTFSMAANDDSA